MKRARITGIGHYVPENVVKNADLETVMDTSDAWILERTGIQERRFFAEGTDTVSKMGAKAARMAMERAAIVPGDIDFILFATLSPDYYFPGSGVLLQKELGLGTVGALDIRTQCSGFIYGLSVADQFIRTGMYKTILVVGSEIQSNIMELSDRGRHVSVIFGDGAGAVVLQASDEPGILSTHLHSEGQYAEELYTPHPGSSRKQRFHPEMIATGELLPVMNGNLVFKHAVVRFEEVIREALDANQLKPENVDLLIPHQANLRISEYIRKKMDFPEEKVYNNIQRYGNTTAASIPIAMSEAWGEGKIQPGSLVCCAAFGSGFTWGSALIRF